jgi:hypothetical protein
LTWLRWLVASQSIRVGAPDAIQQAQSAFQALAELDSALADRASET